MEARYSAHPQSCCVEWHLLPGLVICRSGATKFTNQQNNAILPALSAPLCCIWPDMKGMPCAGLQFALRARPLPGHEPKPKWIWRAAWRDIIIRALSLAGLLTKSKYILSDIMYSSTGSSRHNKSLAITPVHVLMVELRRLVHACSTTSFDAESEPLKSLTSTTRPQLQGQVSP